MIGSSLLLVAMSKEIKNTKNPKRNIEWNSDDFSLQIKTVLQKRNFNKRRAIEEIKIVKKNPRIDVSKKFNVGKKI